MAISDKHGRIYSTLFVLYVYGTVEVFQALKNLGRPVDKWDDWLVFTTT